MVAGRGQPIWAVQALQAGGVVTDCTLGGKCTYATRV